MTPKFTHKLGDKALGCLLMAYNAHCQPMSFKEWAADYIALIEFYSEKAVCTTMEELADRGYLEYGVSPRTGWPTEKGVEALREAGRI